MVQSVNRNMYSSNGNRNHHQVFNFGQYPYNNVSGFQSNGNSYFPGLSQETLAPDSPSTTGMGTSWHNSSVMTPIPPYTTTSSCSRTPGYEEWSPPPSSVSPQGSIGSPNSCGHPGTFGSVTSASSLNPAMNLAPPTAHSATQKIQNASTAFGYGYHHPLPHYRLSHCGNNGQGSPILDYPMPHHPHQFMFPEMNLISGNSTHHPQQLNSQQSPDSGLAHSSDGVPSGSESPVPSSLAVSVPVTASCTSRNHMNQETLSPVASIGAGNGAQRPQPARSPYEWMKKPSYQSQPNPGKTRTKDKYRVVYTDLQRLELEKEFHYSRYITIRRKGELAAMLGLSERQVKIWFQNRRAKDRKQYKKREDGLMKRPKEFNNSLQDQFHHMDHSLMLNQGLNSSPIPHVIPSNQSPLYVNIKPILETESEVC